MPTDPRTEPFSLRLPANLYDRLFRVISATGNEITRTDLIVRALETYLAILQQNPSMIEGYTGKENIAARQITEM